MRKLSVVAPVLFLLGFATVSAQQVDIPIRNWTVPPYTSSSAGGLTTMTDVTSPRVFVAVAPCRLADTRGIDMFTGQAGGPALSSFAERNFQLTGSPSGVSPFAGCPAGTIPSGADAVSLQFTVVFPSSSGNLVAWNAGGTTPNVSVLNWDAGTVALGSGTIVPVSAGGAITVRLNTAAAGQTAHLIIDVNGYFGEGPANQANRLQFFTSSTLAALDVTNLSTGCSLGCAIRAHAESGYGIQAHTQAATGATNGVWGNSNSISANAAGVRGTNGSTFSMQGYDASGVRGESQQVGVLGIGQIQGVAGSLVASGTEQAWGALGWDSGAVNYGVYSSGNFAATGTKSFVDPHPTDPSKVIRYISLEGNEPGTYFRGKGKFERGVARIAVPEDFRMVTDEEGLTVQITPIGGMASFGVMKADLNEIVVQSSRNLEFYYLVNGIRRAYKQMTSPIIEGNDFMPRSAEAKMPAYFSDEQKRLLVQNGTYREDGSVNMETARRVGWDRVWAERERPGTAPGE